MSFCGFIPKIKGERFYTHGSVYYDIYHTSLSRSACIGMSSAADLARSPLHGLPAPLCGPLTLRSYALPTVRDTLSLYRNQCTSSNSFQLLVGGVTPFFDLSRAITKFQGEIPQRGVKYTGVGKCAIFGRNYRLSRKRCEIAS